MTEDHFAQQGYETSSSIQGAVDAVADGGTVFVTGGVYYENVVLESRHDLEIIGEEPVLIVGGFDMDVVSLNRCSGIRFYNIDAVHDTGENCTQNCYAVFESGDISLEYCDISGCGYVGIWVYGWDLPASVRAEYCYIHDCEYASATHGIARLDFFGTVVRGNGALAME